MPIRLTEKSGQSVLGTISEQEFQFLVDHLEEESSRDKDYFIDQATVDILEEAGASASLVSLLRTGVGVSEGIDIAWESV